MPSLTVPATCAALFLLVLSAAAETTYRDPPGRFTVGVPDMWLATAQDTAGMGGVLLRHGTCWVLIGPFGGAADRSDALAQLTDQFKGQYRSLEPVKRGDCKVGGQPASFATFEAVNSKGARVALTLTGIDSATAGVFVMIACAPQSEASSAGETCDHIRESVRWFEPGAVIPPAKQ